MENIKVGSIPVRQAINVNTKFFGVKNNKIGLIIGGASIALLSVYTVLIINFINLIKIIY